MAIVHWQLVLGSWSHQVLQHAFYTVSGFQATWLSDAGNEETKTLQFKTGVCSEIMSQTSKPQLVSYMNASE